MKHFIKNVRNVSSTLVVGLALEAMPLIAMAVQGDPIPGVDVALEQNPGSVMKVVKPDANGNVTASGFTAGAQVIAKQGGLTKTLIANENGEVHWKVADYQPQPLNYNSSKSNTAGISAPSKQNSNPAPAKNYNTSRSINSQ